ncbi:MAG: transposase [Bacteroidales bacterium]|nr:transposase [Bacteroidales bacterium]
MKKETYEAQKAFAGEKKPSMLRRFVGHDYTDRQIYMITMVTEGCRPLFGRIVGRSDAPKGCPDEPRVELSELGRRVVDEWWAASDHHPEIEVVALQMMPDHLHGILFVRRKMEKPLGMAIRGFKQSCNKHYRELGIGCVGNATDGTGIGCVNNATDRTDNATDGTVVKKDRRGEDRTHGLLFARGYNDKLLLRRRQLDAWLHYLEDNPRRLLMKREHPELFRVQRNVKVAGVTFSAIGNRFLLDRPLRIQVRCPRRLTETEIKAKVEGYLAAARGGAVLVSPAISPGEKAVMRAAFDEGLPVVFLQENGFTDLAKPGGARMEACARGQLLILAPWEHHNERIAISRSQCLELNDIARRICE